MKGVYDLLVAFSNLIDVSHQWGLVLLGKDETNGNLKKVTKKLGIENKVLFVGSVKANKVSSYLKAVDVFVFPSRFDGWGVSLNEAAIMKLPLIASDQTGAASHLVEDNKNGFIVQAGNRIMLTEAMQKYINNIKLVSKHGDNSKKLIKYFTPENNVNIFLEALDKWAKTK